MIKTCDELGKLILELAPNAKVSTSDGAEKKIKELSHREMIETIFWFVAFLEANSVATSFSTKDIAGLFVNGLPKMDVAGVENWIETLHEESDYIDASEEELAEAEKFAMAKLRNWIKDHYNIKGKREDEGE